MTLQQGYHWFLPDPYSWNWYETETDDVTCSKKEMLEGISKSTLYLNSMPLTPRILVTAQYVYLEVTGQTFPEVLCYFHLFLWDILIDFSCKRLHYCNPL